MKQQTLKFLQCPACGFSFSIKEICVLFPRTKNIRFGIIACRCGEFPMVEGIVFLKSDHASSVKKERAVQFIRDGQYEKSVLALFEERRRAKFPYWLLVRNYWHPRKIENFLRFLQFVTPASKAWLIHLAQRFRRPTFWLSLATLSTVKSGQIVVDVGCSAGWFLEAVFKHTKASSVTGIDTSFSALFLARKYKIGGKGTLVCADADRGVPIQSGVVDRIFVNDTFMYLKKQSFFLEESSRISSRGALTFVTHVHNAAVQNDGQGNGITARKMMQHAKKHPLWFTADELLFQSFLHSLPAAYKKSIRHIPLLRSPSYSFVIAKNLFTPFFAPAWWKSALKQVRLDYKEDPQLNL